MIMGEHDPGTAVLGSVGDYFPQGKRRASFVARITLDVEAVGTFVDVSDPQAF
jgi:hypothetical protein